MRVGCNIGGRFINILAYADDLVLIAPSWHALQQLLNCLCEEATVIDMKCNTKKTVCMIFSPCKNKYKVADCFPRFKLNSVLLDYVDSFKYLGYMITNTIQDDKDIEREIRNLFVRTNVLMSKFKMCSRSVKIQLFKSFVICLYGSALWKNFSNGTIHKFKSSYNRCIKLFFGYARSYSVTSILLETGLPSCDTLLHNSRVSFNLTLSQTANSVLKSCATITF